MFGQCHKEGQYACDYIDSEGKEKRKIFFDLWEGLSFCKALDEKISQGFCEGYEFSSI